MIKDQLPRYTIQISQILMNKIGYIAECEGCTKDKKIEQLIKKRISEFEEMHGKIDIDGNHLS